MTLYKASIRTHGKGMISVKAFTLKPPADAHEMRKEGAARPHFGARPSIRLIRLTISALVKFHLKFVSRKG